MLLYCTFLARVVNQPHPPYHNHYLSMTKEKHHKPKVQQINGRHHQHFKDKNQNKPKFSNKHNKERSGSHHGPPSSSTSASSSPSAAEFICSLDHRGLQWYELEGSLNLGNVNGGQRKKKKGNNPGGNEKAVNDGSSSLLPGIHHGAEVLDAAVTLFERNTAKKMDSDHRWMEKVLRQGKKERGNICIVMMHPNITYTTTGCHHYCYGC